MSNDFYIASVKNTQKFHAYITFWRPDNKGYAWPLSWAGKYDEADLIFKLWYYNNGCDAIAVRCDVVDAIAVAPKAGTIDNDAGPVVLNSLENWKKLIEATVCTPSNKPKPTYNRTKKFKEQYK